MKFLILLLSVFTLVPGWAGGVNSGGGYVVACKENDKTTYRMWDFVEAEMKTNKLDYLPAIQGADEYELAMAAINRISGFSPDLAAEWQQTIKDFKTFDVKFINNAKIKDIDDADSLFTDIENCELLQVAVQVKKPAGNEFRLYIDETIWKAMDVYTRAGLLVHEAIYKTAMAQGHTKSTDFRRITALLFNRNLDQMSADELASFFKVANINGCFDRRFSYYDPQNGELISQFMMSLEIKNFANYNGNKGFVGVACEDRKIENIFGVGTLHSVKGNKIGGDSRDFCVEDTKEQFDVLRFFQFMGEEEPKFIEDRICLTVSQKDRVIYVGKSALAPVRFSPPALNFEDCIGQWFIDGQFDQCDQAVASITTAENQVIELEKMKYFNDFNAEHYDIKSTSLQLKLEGNTLKLLERLSINSDLEIGLRVARVQKIQIKGVSCTVHPEDHIMLDQNGAFKKIITRVVPFGASAPKYTAESCVKVLN